MSRLRVGLVSPYDMAVPGGVQQITLELAEELLRLGDEVVLLGAGNKASLGGPGLDEVTVLTGRPLRVRANDSVVPLTVTPSWRRVRRALADVDVVHVHEPLVPILGWLALGGDKPTVATFHADPPKWARRLYKAPYVGRRMRRAKLTAVSETAAAAIPAEWGSVRIIPNGIDTTSYSLPVGRVDRRVCFLGRDEPRKGLEVLLRAWPLITERIPQAELKVIGANRPDSLPGVEYLGRVSSGEKKRLLASSLVCAAPNTGGESFGIVIAEAMASGCAVVCSDLPAFRAVLGDAGRLVPIGDPDMLADTVCSLLARPQEARALGGAARARASIFDWSVIGAAYREVYQQAVS
ncbi:MAG TPA: glycosyltransferase family 4 protein [Acidimicrobiia bacterium]|nr:glycosyltransferase family 4 protein [Acidimicrobiia bacterium]